MNAASVASATTALCKSAIHLRWTAASKASPGSIMPTLKPGATDLQNELTTVTTRPSGSQARSGRGAPASCNSL